ncbi:MAG: hypothetical protein HGA54_06245 [Actinobacteria bacterium]|nr:hypothetical protein [Actinomycetota bacterium]
MPILDKYPHFNLAQYGYYMLRFNKVRLLNYVDYSKAGAIELLEREFDWNYYGGKHFESRFTKFFQSYYLPLKFGYDKRRAHLASLVVGGEMQREDALVQMETPYAYPLEQMLEDRDYILKKLDISLAEWEGIMSADTKTEDDYKNNKKLIGALTAMRRTLIGKSI